MQHDGRLSFSPISSLGFEVLSELLAANPGFQWQDETGVVWAVLPAQPDSSGPARTAHAVSWFGVAWTLDPLARRRAIEALEMRLAAVSRPRRNWTANERAIYASLAQALRRLQLADLGMQILTALSD